MGLSADVLIVMVITVPNRHFDHDRTKSYLLSGLSHLGNFILTRKILPNYLDILKMHVNYTRPVASNTTRLLWGTSLVL